MIYFAWFWYLNFYVSQLRPFPEIDGKHHIGEHVSFIDLGLRLHLGLKVTGGNKILMKIVFRLRYEILFVQCSVRDVGNLQEPAVAKALGRIREGKNSKLERPLQSETHLQLSRVRFNVDYALAAAYSYL